MRITVISASALGSYYAAMMHEAGAEISLYDINYRRIERINQQGLLIREGEEERRVYLPAYDSLEDAPPAPLILVMVKSYHTARVAREIARVADGQTRVISIQNGMGNEEELLKALQKEQVFCGVSAHLTYELGPGQCVHEAAGLTTIAPLPGGSLPAAMELARALSTYHIETGATSDILPLRLHKLIVDAATMPLSALHGLRNGEMARHPDVVRDMAMLVVEGLEVAHQMGVSLDSGEVWADVLDLCRKHAAMSSQMLIDVQNGRFTEIESINGSLVRLGEMYGVDTPNNMRMIREIVSIQGVRDSY